MSLHKYYLYIIYFCLLQLCVSSCVNEDMNGCRYYALTVKAVGADGEDICIDSLHSLNVYMFKNNALVSTIPVQANGTFQLGYDKDASLTFVAWANLKTESLNLSKLNVGTKIEDALVELKKENGYNLTSTDLFYARKDFSSTRSSLVEDTAILVLKRTVSSLTIVTKHLTEYFGHSSSYRYEIHGTKKMLNFWGEPFGEEADYSPLTYFDENRNFIAPAFNVFPSIDNEPITVDIFCGENRVFTTSTDMNGVPLKAEAGKQVNILIDFRSALLTFTVSPWNSIVQYVNM